MKTKLDKHPKGWRAPVDNSVDKLYGADTTRPKCLLTLNVSGIPYTRSIKKGKTMKLNPNPSKRYTLFQYTSNGQQVISAIHQLDLMLFLIEHPEAKRVR